MQHKSIIPRPTGFREHGPLDVLLVQAKESGLTCHDTVPAQTVLEGPGHSEPRDMLSEGDLQGLDILVGPHHLSL